MCVCMWVGICVCRVLVRMWVCLCARACVCVVCVCVYVLCVSCSWLLLGGREGGWMGVVYVRGRVRVFLGPTVRILLYRLTVTEKQRAVGYYSWFRRVVAATEFIEPAQV